MKRTLALIAFSLSLVACGVDKTGLSAESARGPAGNPNAVVTVTEFADLQCPACKSAHDLLQKPLLEKYGTQISYEFKHFPLQTIHQYALDLAMGSECAADQGKFWEFVDVAYTQQDQLVKLGRQAPGTWAESLALDRALFDRCVASRIKKDTVLADYDQGIKLGVQGTPTFFVNGVKTASTLDALSKAIEAGVGNAATKF